MMRNILIAFAAVFFSALLLGNSGCDAAVVVSRFEKKTIEASSQFVADAGSPKETTYCSYFCAAKADTVCNAYKYTATPTPSCEWGVYNSATAATGTPADEYFVRY